MSRKNERRVPKVAYITGMSGLGGGETSLLNLLQQMDREGNDTLLICPQGILYDTALKSNLHVIALDFPPLRRYLGIIPGSFPLKTVIELTKILKTENVDILHIESLAGLYYGGAAAFLARIPRVATFHGFWDFQSPFVRFFANRICQRLYPVSDWVSDGLASVVKDHVNRVKVIPLGVNQKFLVPLPPQGAIRQSLGLPADRPVLLQIARYQEVKGHLYLLEALRQLIDRQECTPPPLLLLAGDVLEPAKVRDLAYKSEVMDFIKSKGLTEYVSVLGHRNDTPFLMKSADIVINPSSFEGFGMVIAEAMMVGVPVIATDAGNPARMIRHMQTGLLVPPENATALAGAIHWLLSDHTRAREIAALAQIEALDHYSPEKRCETLLTEYASLSSKRV